MQAIDQYMLRQTARVVEDARRWYEEFAFHKIYHGVNHFCVVELSAFYFDVLKDRLYTASPKSKARRAAQTAIWRIGEALVRLLAPITTFTSEEVWQYLPKVEGRRDSVHLEVFSNATDIAEEVGDPKEGEAWTALRSVREEVLKGFGRGPHCQGYWRRTGSGSQHYSA